MIYGVGINDADYPVNHYEELPKIGGKRQQKIIWRCPYHVKWTTMLRRCYSGKDPAYSDCVVDPNWLTFSNFKTWMEQKDWEGKHLDKDLLVRGNKVYGPDTCAFVSKEVNNFILENRQIRGDYKIGVSWSKRSEKFMTCCKDPFKKRSKFVGLFTTEEEAHEAWRVRKEQYANEITKLESDSDVIKALQERYSKEVWYA